LEAQSREPRVYLPDFCAAGTILVVLLVAELVAILLTLAAHTPEGRFLTELAKMSMYVLWLALLSAAVLCQVRPRVEALGPARAFTICFVLIEALCLVVAEITYRLTDIFGAAAIINDTHGGFLLRSFAISTIILALSLRYLYISSEWRRSIVLEAQARISALQALIRPHFLFNSMNTIASLTRSNPARAEEAVEDLADLLRANLGGPRDLTTLKEELEVAAIYQRIEKLRLGDRLRVRWDIGELPMRALIPSLTIQPLLENAIYHGIEMLPDGGEVTIRGQRRDDRLSITVSNPVVAESKRKKSGNRMALDNIVQRYELAYGNRASVTAGESDGHFRVHLDFPCEESRT
jgi:two-component system sensor histidine kinase AlgZ